MPDYRVGVVERGPLVANIGGGLKGHAYYRVRDVVRDESNIALVLKVSLLGGSYKVTELQLDSETTSPITTEFLRTIPLRTLVDMTVGQELRGLNADKAFDLSGSLVGEDADHRHTAFVYRLARLLGEPPVKAVMKNSGISRATATRRVAAARRAGYLRDDEVGQAGGMRSPRARS